MAYSGGNSALRFVEASRIQGPSGGRGDGVVLRNSGDQAIGNLEGVLVDPIERRLLFYVVESNRWLRSRHYLLPSHCTAQMTDDGRSLRVDLDASDLERCEEFRSSSVPRYSDDDLLASMFRQHPT